MTGAGSTPFEKVRHKALRASTGGHPRPSRRPDPSAAHHGPPRAFWGLPAWKVVTIQDPSYIPATENDGSSDEVAWRASLSDSPSGREAPPRCGEIF